MTFTKMDIYLKDFYIKHTINSAMANLKTQTINSKNKSTVYKSSLENNDLIKDINTYKTHLNNRDPHDAYLPLTEYREYSTLMSICQMNLDNIGGITAVYTALTPKEAENCKKLYDLCELYIKHQTTKFINEIAKD